LLFYRKTFSRFDFTGDCQWTRVELCACTSDRERSTRALEACTYLNRDYYNKEIYKGQCHIASR